jgi:hypothetical protein
MIRSTVSLVLGFAFLAASVSAEEKKFVEFSSFHRNIDVRDVKLYDDVWKTVATYKQPLQRQFLIEPKPIDVGVKEVLVQSIHDGKYIAFRLVWKDPVRNDSPKIMNFSDGASIQFPVKKNPLPEYFMGALNMPVHILYWKAWRSADRKNGYQNAKTAYPNMAVNLYQFDYPVQGTGTAKTQAEKDIFIPGKAAGNPVSLAHKEVIEELSAEGPGTLKSKALENTTGEAEWKNGEWTLVFRRPMSVEDSGSVQFKTGETMPVAFAVWEGSRNESAGRKAVSPAWAEVKVEP